MSSNLQRLSVLGWGMHTGVVAALLMLTACAAQEPQCDAQNALPPVSTINVFPLESRVASEAVRLKLLRGRWWKHPFPIKGKVCRIEGGEQVVDARHGNKTMTFTLQFDALGHLEEQRIRGLDWAYHEQHRYHQGRVVVCSASQYDAPEAKGLVWMVHEFDGNTVASWSYGSAHPPQLNDERRQQPRRSILRGQRVERLEGGKSLVDYEWDDQGRALRVDGQRFSWSADGNTASAAVSNNGRDVYTINARDELGNVTRAERLVRDGNGSKRISLEFRYKYCD